MKKTLIGLFMAGLAAGCGGTTEGDIRDAATALDDQEQASRLRLAPGDFWATSLIAKEISEFGSVGTSGEFSPFSAIMESVETKQVRVHKVMGATYVSAADKNGYVVEQVARTTDETTVVGSTTTEETVSPADTRFSYVLYEFDAWVRTMVEDAMGDLDTNPSEADFPIAPRIGALYTNDRGTVWEAVQAETVGGVNAVKLTRVFPPEEQQLANFYTNCFTVTDGTVAGSKNITLKPACDGSIVVGGEARFTISREHSIWVGGQRIQRAVSRVETVTLDELLCGNVGSTFNTGLSDCTQPVTLGRAGGGPEREIEEVTTELTKAGRAADVEALPEIADAE